MPVAQSAQQRAVFLWKFLENTGERPSVRKVVAMMRAGGMPISDRAAAEYLSAFAERNPHPKANRQQKTPHERRIDDASSGTPAEEKTRIENASTDTLAALYAGDKVSLVSKTLPTPTESLRTPTVSSLQTDSIAQPSLLGDEVPAKAIKHREDHRPPILRQAHEALDLIRPLVEPVLVGKTWTEWRKQNSRFAQDMIRSGMTPESILDACESYAEGHGGRVATVLRWVQDDLTNQAAREAAAPASPEMRVITAQEREDDRDPVTGEYRYGAHLKAVG